ncbi:MAG: hypothetical protein UV73_C0002G0057 [Candidatus Gottesmanbacteria bacterium GW2011_GWA2_43_14]|uniref:Uncharacterized protein n=1 Tax=Candidatus Gottesmanbacteria bacterium GW2011_GWA2_43_14 TaxID=1618443 RepID=A0A0G1GHS3_9BACT|nr:MAG: hypothetical protein UV73_C0002G0057 [Candidatus Gottesmanbacteria bacterium GW2011_GWA2_43_14]
MSKRKELIINDENDLPSELTLYLTLERFASRIKSDEKL